MRHSRFAALFFAFNVTVLATACAQATPADELYAAGKPLVNDLRSQIFGIRDLVSDSRATSEPQMKEYYRKRAQRLLETARHTAAKLEALITQEETKGEDADDLAKYTLRVLKQQYEAYTKWLDEAETAVASLTSQSSPPEEEAGGRPADTVDEPPVPDTSDADESSNTNTAETSDFPTSEDLLRQSRIIMRVEAVLHEIYLEQAHARTAYYREGMGQRMQLAFYRHGATGRHGWIGSWADSLWIHQYGHVSDARYEHFRLAAEKFRAQISHAEKVTPAHLEYADRLVNLLPTWRQDIREQYATLDNIIDLYGQLGAAGEQGNQKWHDRAEAEANRLLEQLRQPSPVKIEPFGF